LTSRQKVDSQKIKVWNLDKVDHLFLLT